MSGALLKHELREGLGIAKGNTLGEELFSEVGKKFWNMGERKEGEVRQRKKNVLKIKLIAKLDANGGNECAVMGRKTHGLRNEI